MARIRQSAGILLYRQLEPDKTEVLLVHPGGPFHQHKDLGAWSVPKGEFEADELPLAAAKREFQEELGSPAPEGNYITLTPVRQKNGKLVMAWAVAGNLDCTRISSNTCRVEYPYKSGKWISIPEVDRAAWFALSAAKQKINPAQVALLEELAEKLRFAGQGF